jgi:hypothetical protein
MPAAAFFAALNRRVSCCRPSKASIRTARRWRRKRFVLFIRQTAFKLEHGLGVGHEARVAFIAHPEKGQPRVVIPMIILDLFQEASEAFESVYDSQSYNGA